MDYKKVPTSPKKATHENNLPMSGEEPLWMTLLTILSCCAATILLFNTMVPILSDQKISPEFYIKSFSVSSLNIEEGADNIRANFSIIFSVINPANGLNILYETPKVTVLYRNEIISAANMDSFYQTAGQESLVKANLPASPAHVDAEVAHEMNFGRIWERELPFAVEVDAELTLNDPGTSELKKIEMKVSCEDIKVKFLYSFETARTHRPWTLCKFI